MSEDDQEGEPPICPPPNRLDNFARLAAGLVLVGVVLVDMLGLWEKEPPTWFLGVLLLLALGVEITAIRKIVVDIMQKQFAKK